MENCNCFSCDMKEFFEDEIVMISFESSNGLIQETEMFLNEAEELLARWIVE